MHLVEFNIARLHAPLDEPSNREFVAALDGVNLIGERADGFVWRLQDDSGRSSSYITSTDDANVIVNLTVWESVEALRDFTYRSGHSAYFRRRREWFEADATPRVVCWWIAAGEVPTLEDASERLEHLRRHGPSERGFPLKQPLPPPTTTTPEGLRDGTPA